MPSLGIGLVNTSRSYSTIGYINMNDAYMMISGDINQSKRVDDGKFAIRIFKEKNRGTSPRHFVTSRSANLHGFL
jgi:hypothetical protein